MILLDTNVVSDAIGDRPDMAITDWLDARPAESVWTTSITVFEVRMGFELMGESRRRRQLEEAFEAFLTEDLDGRVQPFDQAAAVAAAVIGARQQRRGRPVGIRDTQIAGIAAARKATLATRNARHFEGLGLSLVDPSAGSSPSQ